MCNSHTVISVLIVNARPRHRYVYFFINVLTKSFFYPTGQFVSDERLMTKMEPHHCDSKSVGASDLPDSVTGAFVLSKLMQLFMFLVFLMMEQLDLARCFGYFEEALFSDRFCTTQK